MKKWTIEILLFSLYLVFGLSWLAYVPIADQLKEAFAINNTENGVLITSAVSLANALGPILAGWLGARWGLYRGIGLGATLCALAALNPWVTYFPAAVLVRFLFGLGGGLVATLMGPMTMRWFPPSSWANLNGFNNVSVNVGITLALFTTVPLSASLGWRMVLTYFGLLAALLASLWWFLGSEGVEAQATSEQIPVTLSETLRQRQTWWLTLGFAGPLASFLALNTFLAKHLIETQGLNANDAADVVGVLSLAGLGASPLGGWATTRLGLRRPLVIGCGILLPILSMGLLWEPHPYFWAALVGIAFLFYLAPFFTIPMELPGATPQSVGLMTGAVLSLSYLLACGSPVLVGELGDHYGAAGFGLGLTLFAALSGSIALGAWLLPETGRSCDQP